MLAIGLMSGTSMDGLDIALCEIEGTGIDLDVKLLDFFTVPYEASLRTQIAAAIDLEHADIQTLATLDFVLGRVFADGVKQMMQKNSLSSSDIAFVASHGQTIYHAPDAKVPTTMQLGQAAVIAYENDVDVYSDFRVMDIAAGGQGAPLVPYADYILYRSDTVNIALQNIGGIGNVTFLPKGCSLDDVIAFDTGPGNMMIDEAMEQLYGLPYDDRGETAAHGEIIVKMFEELMDHPYLKLTPPKSTGRELFGVNYTRSLLSKYQSEKPEDLVATLTEFTAYCIYQSYQAYFSEENGKNYSQCSNTVVDRILLSGGGAHNMTIQNALQKYFPDTQVQTQSEIGWNDDAKEAIAFALLGHAASQHLPSNVPNATGAKEAVVLGVYTPAPKGSHQ